MNNTYRVKVLEKGGLPEPAAKQIDTYLINIAQLLKVQVCNNYSIWVKEPIYNNKCAFMKYLKYFLFDHLLEEQYSTTTLIQRLFSIHASFIQWKSNYIPDYSIKLMQQRNECACECHYLKDIDDSDCKCLCDCVCHHLRYCACEGSCTADCESDCEADCKGDECLCHCHIECNCECHTCFCNTKCHNCHEVNAF